MRDETAAAGWMAAEIEALGYRLAAVPRFASTIPMVFDATPALRALNLADAVTDRSKKSLALAIQEFRNDALRSTGVGSFQRMQRRYLAIRGRFDALLATVDIFADALTQRAEHSVGVLLRGLDALADDGLRVQVEGFDPIPIVCFFDRGRGGAVRRAFTTLPDGEMNAVALIKLPRERLFGVGLASLLHEVGHQGVAMLSLVEPFVKALRVAAWRGRLPGDVAAWVISKITEILPDLWACGKLGVTATLGLFGVLGGTKRATFREDLLDPHPMIWSRGVLSAEFGAATMPHPIWAQLLGLWKTMYPPEQAPPADRELVLLIAPYLREVARTLASARPRQLRGATLTEALESADVAPGVLLPKLRSYLASLTPAVRPCHALAVIGLSRYAGVLGPRTEIRYLRTLTRLWAEQQAQFEGPVTGLLTAARSGRTI